MAKNDAVIQNQSQMIQIQAATLKNLENQVRKLANALTNHPQGTLPSNTENPRRDSKEHCKAITLRNGRVIEDPIDELKHKGEPTSIQQATNEVAQDTKLDAEIPSSTSHATASLQQGRAIQQNSKPAPPFPQRLQKQQQEK